MATAKEVCIGCGIVAKPGTSHPFVGVGREDLDANAGSMVAHPVCEACYLNPDHRAMRSSLKVVFFGVADAPVATAAAQATDRQSKAGGGINIGG